MRFLWRQSISSGREIPAACLAQNPEWLRPLVGLTPRGEDFLYYLSTFDLGRDENGRWRVLADRVKLHLELPSHWKTE